MTKVSIIVPVYNVEKYLTKCIESLLLQSLKDIEIILVDDGATDKSPDICDAYELKDNRIKVIHKTNGGLSDARNVGIEVAQGEYIAFLDSDDWVEPNMYQYLYELIQKNNADIAQCSYIKAYEEEVEIEFAEDIKESVYTGVEALELLYGQEYIKTVVVWNKLYHKKLFKHIRYPKGKVHEDEFTTYKVIHKAGKFVNSNIPMVYYRQREDSIMAQGFNEKRIYILEAWREEKDYFEQHELNDLVLKTECKLCGILKSFYVQAQKSNLINKKEVLRYLKKDMRKNYIRYIRNSYITSRGKITLTLCLLNGKVFTNIYDKYAEK